MSSSLYDEAVQKILLQAQNSLDRLRADFKQRKMQVGHRLVIKAETQYGWKPNHDYLADWNDLCGLRGGSDGGFKPIKQMTPRRKKHLMAREREKWDWQGVISELRYANTRWVQGFKGFGFDWIIGSTDNWVRCAEGKYSDPALKTPTSHANAPDNGAGKFHNLPSDAPDSGIPERTYTQQEVASSVWATALATLETTVDPHSFDVWLLPARARGYDMDGTLGIEVPSDIHAEWIADKYQDAISAVLSGAQWRLIARAKV